MAFLSLLFEDRTEQNRTEQNRTEQNESIKKSEEEVEPGKKAAGQNETKKQREVTQSNNKRGRGSTP